MNKYMNNYRVVFLLFSFISVFFMQSCVKNDIPYPTIPLNILDSSVDGMLGRHVIANDDKTIAINIADTANLKKIRIASVSYTEGASGSLAANDVIDLTRTHWVTVSLYDDTYWRISATQEIERIFSIENQVGVATFDVNNKIAYANVMKDDFLMPQYMQLKLKELKLGPTGSTINNVVTMNPSVTWTWENSF